MIEGSGSGRGTSHSLTDPDPDLGGPKLTDLKHCIFSAVDLLYLDTTVAKNEMTHKNWRISRIYLSAY